MKVFLNNIKKLNNNWIFENVIALLFIFFGLLGWYFTFMICAVAVLLLTASLLILFNDTKYIIPGALVMLFSYNRGYVVEEFPFDIVIPVAIYAVIVVIFIIKNFKLSNLFNSKSYIGMVIIAIAFIIPIFWSERITKDNSILYIMYFSWALYLLLFFVLVLSLNNNSFKILVFSFSYLSVLIALQCIITPVQIYLSDTSKNLFSIIFELGWGVCNEGGIMLCFLMPFVFYELLKTKNITLTLIVHFKLILILVGILLTTSRGALLFGSIEYVALNIVNLILTKNRVLNICILLSIFSIGIVSINQVFGISKIINDLSNNTFEKGLRSDARLELWRMAFDRFSRTWYTAIFGSGIVTDFDYMRSFRGEAMIYVVYHSTFFEMLVSAGIIGVIGLAIHFFEKYKQLIKTKDKLFISIMIVGYIIVDLYGMIDNTYGMYYYMVPLVIMLVVIDKTRCFELYNNKKYVELF